MAAYDAGHERKLTAALNRLKLLPAAKEAPSPFQRASGVAGESIVYFLYLPTKGKAHRARNRWLVVKFEKRPQRATREWRAVAALRRDPLLPDNILLPIDGSKAKDGCIIFDAAQGRSTFQNIATLQDLLINQLENNPDNCVASIEKVVQSLRAAFHKREPGMRTSAVGTGPQKWSAWFHGITDTANQTKIATRVTGATDAARTLEKLRTERKLPLEEHRELQQRLASPDEMTKQAGATAYDLHFSRVHGDMNMTNALLSLARDRTPDEDFIIDIPHSKPNQPTALDFARLEVDFFLTVLPALIKDEDELLDFSARLRDHLDGRAVTTEPATRLWQNSLRLMTTLRRKAELALNDLALGDRFKYAMVDLASSLYFYYLKALLWDSTGADKQVRELATLCAGLSVEFLHDIAAGRYAGASEHHFRLWTVLDPDRLTLSAKEQSGARALAKSLSTKDAAATAKVIAPLIATIVPHAAHGFSPSFVPAIQRKLLELLSVDRVMDDFTKSYLVTDRQEDGTLVMVKTTTYFPVNLTNRSIRLHPAIEYELHESRRIKLTHFSVVSTGPGPAWKRSASFTLGDRELTPRQSYRDGRTPVMTYVIDSEFMLPPYDPVKPRPYQVTFEEEISASDIDGDHIVTDRVLNGVTVKFDPGAYKFFEFSAGDGDLVETVPNREWKLQGVLLPEQKISVRWRKVV
jgi:hypothetical protein